jgi:hypothetical protein
MNIFVKKNDRVEIDVFVWEDEKTELQATVNQSEVPNSTDAKILKFFFRRPSYADSQNIIKQSQIRNGLQTSIDSILFQDVLLHSLLVEWDLKPIGDDTPCSSVNIDNLNPLIARVAVEGVIPKITI